jgi:uncharacterized protein with HEPN domain
MFDTMKNVIYIMQTKFDILDFQKIFKMKRHFVLYLLIIILPCFAIHAQDSDLESRIKEQLKKPDQKKTAKAEKLYQAAAGFKSQAEKLESSSEKKALKKNILASQNNGKANRIKYKVYYKDLKKFAQIDTHDSAKVIKKKIKRAKKIMRHTNGKRELALKLTNDNNAYSLLKHADELEIKALRDLDFVYGLLMSITKKGKEDVKIITGIDDGTKIKESTLVNEFEKNKAIGEDVSNENKLQIGQNNVVPEKLGSVILKEKTLPVPIKDSMQVETEQELDVYFKIQIAASKTQFTVDQLERNFETKEALSIEIDGEWYKYSIRKKFADYDEALAYKEMLKIRGTFIIAYKNGKKVSIDEALKKEIPKAMVNENQQIDVPEKIKPDEIVYRLQIGFSTKRMSAAELNMFHHTGQEIMTIDCGSWFIYTIGRFDTEAGAIQFKKQKGLTDAELVKFVNGKLTDK